MQPLPASLPWRPSSNLPRPSVPRATSFPDSSHEQCFPPAVASLLRLQGPRKALPQVTRPEQRTGCEAPPWLPPPQPKMPCLPWACALSFSARWSPESGRGLAGALPGGPAEPGSWRPWPCLSGILDTGCSVRCPVQLRPHPLVASRGALFLVGGPGPASRLGRIL